jgi:hypothetical protein
MTVVYSETFCSIDQMAHAASIAAQTGNQALGHRVVIQP